MNERTDDQPDDQHSPPDEAQTTQDVPPDTEWDVVTQIPYEPSGADGLTTTIIYAIADAEDVSPSDITNPPLYEVIDTAALDDALFGAGTGARTGECATEFMYRDYRVVVQTDGWIQVHEPVES